MGGTTVLKPTRDQQFALTHEPDSLFPRMDRARKFTDEEFEAELRKIAKQLQVQGRPLIDTTWRMKTWSEVTARRSDSER